MYTPRLGHTEDVLLIVFRQVNGGKTGEQPVEAPLLFPGFVEVQRPCKQGDIAVM